MAEFPITLSTLVDRVRRLMEDYPEPITLNQGGALDATTTTLTVDDNAKVHNRSRVEFDNEVMLVVEEPDTDANNDIEVQRGFIGTAASHSDAIVGRVDPRWPRVNIIEAINTVLADWCTYYFPRLEWDTTTAGSFTTNEWIYEAPSDAVGIVRVTWQTPGYTHLQPVPHSQLRTYDTAVITSGFGFEVYKMGLPGQEVRVLYEKRWDFLEADADEIGGASLNEGFPADATDLLVTGAAIYLSGWRQIPKYKLDEGEFHTRAGDTIPRQTNLSRLRMETNRWVERAKQVASRRPDAGPRKVYVGFRG